MLMLEGAHYDVRQRSPLFVVLTLLGNKKPPTALETVENEACPYARQIEMEFSDAHVGDRFPGRGVSSRGASRHDRNHAATIEWSKRAPNGSSGCNDFASSNDRGCLHRGNARYVL
jgi:hypothetical protein